MGLKLGNLRRLVLIIRINKLCLMMGSLANPKGPISGLQVAYATFLVSLAAHPSACPMGCKEPVTIPGVRRLLSTGVRTPRRMQGKLDLGCVWHLIILATEPCLRSRLHRGGRR